MKVDDDEDDYIMKMMSFGVYMRDSNYKNPTVTPRLLTTYVDLQLCHATDECDT